MIKKIIFLILILFMSAQCFAYTPTTSDEVVLNEIYKKLDQIIQKNQDQAESIATKIAKVKLKYLQYPRVYYVLNELEKYINVKLLENKDELEVMFLGILGDDLEEKTDYYELSQDPKYNQKREKNLEYKQDFFGKYGLEIVGGNFIDERCVSRYDFIDKISKEHNFPTALVIATWRIEHSCIFSNPKNRHGQFQLWSRDYGVGDMSEENFKTQIIDFINFCKYKRDRYEKKEKWESGTIKITYDEYDFESIRLHGLIYNGLYAGHTPHNSMYVNGNLNKSLAYKKDGLITNFLKVIKWEIDNGKY